MKKTIILTGILFFISILSTWSIENVEFTRDNLKNNKRLRYVYYKYVKKGDKFYYKRDRGYLIAVEYYLMAFQEHPNSASLNYKIANCYLNTSDKYKALEYIVKAYELNPTVSEDIYFTLGKSHHLSGEFDKALVFYQKFRNNYKGDDIKLMQDVIRNMDECKNALELINQPMYEVENLGNIVNTEYAEYVPIIKADEDFMLFTSRRPLSNQQSLDDKKKIKGERLSGFDFEYFEDIFKSDLSDSVWSTPTRYSYSTNQVSTHDACVSLSFDGQTIFNYRGKNGGDLYMSKNVDGKWTKMQPLKGINSKYREDHVVMSSDNKTIYFISDRPGGFGGTDIWKSEMNANGDWTTPINLGPNINTPFNEEGVFIHPDGKTLYFSSKGHNTIGGYDVFESTWEDGHWGEPINMGVPVNSGDDDLFFVLTPDGNTAYLSSVKPDGFGMQDIYSISSFTKIKDLLESNAVDTAQSLDTLLAGETNNTSENESGLLVGKYRRILFEYNKSNLGSMAIGALDSLCSALISHPSLKIEIEGHADNVGWSKDNMLLSEKRAESVYQYLIIKGIEPSRIIRVVGYGESNPIDNNNTEEGREHNRRVDCRFVE